MNKQIKQIIIACLGLIIFVTQGKAQNVPITWEPGQNGNAWTWTPFENVTNLPIQVVANPNPSGINSSATVVTMTALQGGQPWAGFESQHGAGIGTFTLNSSNAIVKIMVYKSVISDVGIKFATAINTSTGELKVANTLINQWEELTFDFSSKIGEPTSTNIDQIVFFPDFQLSPVRSSDNICYFDNVTFSAVPSPTSPLMAAPAPTASAANVISMFSNAYTNVGVDTWLTSWSAATHTDLQITGNDTKKYGNLNFAGIETTGANFIDATTMNTFNIDVWSADATLFRIKLVDFGANASFGGGDDVEHELIFTPTLLGWNSYHIPLSNFSGLTTRAHMAQLIFSAQPAGSANIFIDNVYYSIETQTSPLVAAPTPTASAANVISMFSNAYTNVGVDTWLTSWSAATHTDLQIAGNDTKKYSNLNFAGIETTGANFIDATTMNTFNIDIWSADASVFRIKLVDFGANASYGGGDDVEHELIFTPTLLGWNSYHIPLANFTGLTTKAHLAQLILSALPAGTANVYIDNVYFSLETPTAPIVAAPTPTALSSNVISMYSNAYTNVGVDTWLTSWSAGTLTDLQIQGNNTKRYHNLSFVGVETTGSNLINATSMNTFNIDVWTPNMTNFKIKLVDFGANATFGGGDDVEHELTLIPSLFGWNSYHIPLSDFVGLTTKAHMAQYIFSGSPSGTGNVYIDNVYFSYDPPLVPIVAAPTPTASAANVISMFSEAYTNVGVDTWLTSWSAGTLTDLQIQGNSTKRYHNLSFVGIETTGANLINATSMNTFNIDVWTPNMTNFKIKLVDFGANATFGGGDDVEHELTLIPSLYGWNSYHISLNDFTGLTTRAHMAQYIISGSPSGTGNVYIDNVYFSVEAKIKVTCLLQGPYISSSIMKPVLFNQAVSSSLTECDEVIVELHNPTAPYAMAHSFTDTLSTTGMIDCTFPIGAAIGSYYLVVKHRNSVETWSSVPKSLFNTNSYNFTTAASQAFGSNMIEIETGIWAFYGGDIDQNGVVDNPDYSIWESDANDFASGYYSSDIDGDGSIDNLDYSIWELNSNNFVGKMTP